MQPNVVHVHKVCIDWYARLISCVCIVYYCILFLMYDFGGIDLKMDIES